VSGGPVFVAISPFRQSHLDVLRWEPVHTGLGERTDSTRFCYPLFTTLENLATVQIANDGYEVSGEVTAPVFYWRSNTSMFGLF
jgi:hypothetical protein